MAGARRTPEGMTSDAQNARQIARSPGTANPTRYGPMPQAEAAESVLESRPNQRRPIGHDADAPANPILSSMREWGIQPLDALETLNGYSITYDHIDDWCDAWEGATPEQVEHARSVLSNQTPDEDVEAGVTPRINCAECGESVIVDANEVSHHVDADGDIDHDRDAEHVALPEVELISFTDAEGDTLRIFRDPDDEEGYLIRGPKGKTVGFRAGPNTAPADLIEDAAEFWADDEFGDEDEDEDEGEDSDDEMALERLKDANSFGGQAGFELEQARYNKREEDKAERAAERYRHGG